jgi:tRNA A-37 threonylcarbamoyl transferase component Bud32/membrane-associated phospholipid phosphatase
MQPDDPGDLAAPVAGPERPGVRLPNTGARRRPSGEPPPLPREAGWRAWAWATAGLVAACVAIHLAIVDLDAQTPILRWFQDLRTPVLVDIAEIFDALCDPLTIWIIRVVVLVVAALLKRWRHAVTILALYVVVDFLNTILAAHRPEPDGVSVLSTNATTTFPSLPVAALSVTLFGAVMVLAPSGRPRRLARAGAFAIMVLVVLARLLLGADYPIDAVYSLLIGWVTVGFAFAFFVPEDVFPVSYARGGKSAHLDLGGARGEAIIAAVRDQLGFTVTEIEPFGLAGSGGSSPLRMRVAEIDGHLFGKIYSTGHLRADRWYKVGRTILYGQLEDEVPLGSVRRLALYEDYALRLLRDVGIGVATTYGIVELTPDREYMLVTEFFSKATTLGDAEVDDAIVDEGMLLVQRLWASGLAHRDLKPANMLVRGGHLQLVDVSGLQVRPTPWRQAVDLANMMLTMALRSDPDRVYERATAVFSPGDVAEAFAATRGLAIPTQLSEKLKEDGRPILERFRELAPDRPPVSIQVWSVRRLALTVAAIVAALALAAMVWTTLAIGLD